MRVVETSNFDEDYPNEQFVNLPRMTKDHANLVVDAINLGFGEHCTRYWKVVEDDYTLAPGFVP